jgi:hypothetical protein
MEEIDSEQPLDRLRSRSAEQRWKTLKQETLPAAPRPESSSSPSPTALPSLEEFPEFNANSARPAESRPEIPTLDDTSARPAASELPTLPNFESEPVLPTPRTPQAAPRRDPFAPPVPVARSRAARRRQAAEQEELTLGPLRPLDQIMPYHDYESVRPDLKLDPDDLPPDIDVNRVPVDAVLTDLPTSELAPRLTPDTVFSWEASNIWHNPLYFEDPTVERYGHTGPPVLQPLYSITRLGVQLVGLPYQMTIDPVRKRRYILGWYQPGDYVPHKFYQVPLNLKAAAVQAGAVAAGVVILP